MSKSLFNFSCCGHQQAAVQNAQKVENKLLQDVDYIKTEERRFACCLTSSDNSATSRRYLLNALQRTYRRRMCRVARMKRHIEIMLHLQEQHVHATKRNSCLQQCGIQEDGSFLFCLELNQWCQSSSRTPSQLKVRNRNHLERNRTTLCY